MPAAHPRRRGLDPPEEGIHSMNIADLRKLVGQDVAFYPKADVRQVGHDSRANRIDLTSDRFKRGTLIAVERRTVQRPQQGWGYYRRDEERPTVEKTLTVAVIRHTDEHGDEFEHLVAPMSVAGSWAQREATIKARQERDEAVRTEGRRLARVARAIWPDAELTAWRSPVRIESGHVELDVEELEKLADRLGLVYATDSTVEPTDA